MSGELFLVLLSGGGESIPRDQQKPKRHSLVVADTPRLAGLTDPFDRFSNPTHPN
jgi:hypothetical protein